MKVKYDHRSKFPTWAVGKKKPEKNQGFNGIRTRDLPDKCLNHGVVFSSELYALN